MPKVKGSLFYVFTNNIDKKYKQWKCTVVVDNTEAKKLHDAGLKTDLLDDMKDSEEMCAAGTRKKTFYRKLYRRGATGGKNDPPNCIKMNEDGSKEWFNSIVGNGSEGFVYYATYPWSNDFGEGIGADFKGVMITKLVEYEGGEVAPDPDDDDFMDIGGERKVKTDFDDIEDEIEDEADAPTETPSDNPDIDDEAF